MNTEESQKWVPSSHPIPIPVRRRRAEVVPSSQPDEQELLSDSGSERKDSPPMAGQRPRSARRRRAEVVPSSQPDEQELLSDSGSDREDSSRMAGQRPSSARTEHSPQAEVIPTSQSVSEGEITPEWAALVAARAAVFKLKYVPSYLDPYYSYLGDE